MSQLNVIETKKSLATIDEQNEYALEQLKPIPNDADIRAVYAETIKNMLINPSYNNNFCFYAYFCNKLVVSFTNDLPTLGVLFNKTRYELHINPDFFNSRTLEERMFMLAHEVLHIINNHLDREENKNHEMWNISTDIAINQRIQGVGTPEGCLMPNYIPTDVLNQNAEYYYSLIENKQNQNQNQNSNNQNSNNQNQNSNNQNQSSNNQNSDNQNSNNQNSKIGTHKFWGIPKELKELAKNILKKDIEQTIKQTLKQRGNLPKNIDEILETLTTKAQVDWKKVLKNILGNKKIGFDRTLMRNNRRFRDRPELKGRKPLRTFDLLVMVDVSGSMEDNIILKGLNEIYSICKTSKANAYLMQFDTAVLDFNKLEPKTINSNKIKFNRKGTGGTIIKPCFEYIRKNKIEYDALIVITDGYLETDKFNSDIIFLHNEDEFPLSKYKNFKLNV